MLMYASEVNRCCLFVFISGALLQGVLAFSQELPDAPSVARNASFAVVERSDAASDAPNSPAAGSLDPGDNRFFGRWAMRGLRDQAGIYTAPFHRSALK